MNSTIIFENVSKKFSRGFAADSLRDAIIAPIKYLINGSKNRQTKTKQNEEFWALKNVSFKVKSGEALGIIGPNGSGKSTTLKLLSRILKPDSGKIIVKGRVGALIELGAGFHPDLTGRENVFLNASILGMGKEEIKRKYDEIVEFAGLHEFMDTPVKWYSSGMHARLGFSVAVHIDPNILLIDEVLSVGDFEFKDKCIEKMKEFIKSGVTMVVVSHDRSMMERLCNKGILLKSGNMIACGDIKVVLDKYYSDIVENKSRDAELLRKVEKSKFPIEITGVKVLDIEGKEKNSFLTSEGMKVQIYYRANNNVEDPCFYCRIFNPELSSTKGTALVHGSNSERFNLKLKCEAGDEGVVEIYYKHLNLLNGKYFVNVGIMPNYFSPNTYDRIDKAATVTVSSRIEQGVGVVFIDHNWRVETKCNKMEAGR